MELQTDLRSYGKLKRSWEVEVPRALVSREVPSRGFSVLLIHSIPGTSCSLKLESHPYPYPTFAEKPPLSPAIPTVLVAFQLSVTRGQLEFPGSEYCKTIATEQSTIYPGTSCLFRHYAVAQAVLTLSSYIVTGCQSTKSL